MDLTKYVSLTDYAAMKGLDASTIRQKILRGNFPEAVKIGRNWLVPKDAEYLDYREKKNKDQDKKA